MDHAADAEDATPAPLPELTDELIDAALERARRAVRGPREERCYAFSYGEEEDRKRCAAQGRCKIGWLGRARGRQVWEA